jgi:hypothetical protein
VIPDAPTSQRSLINPNREGLGLDNANNATSVVQTMASQSQISSPLFAFKLERDGGVLSIGGLDPTVYSGTPTYTPLTQEGSWQITFDSFTVNGTSVVGSTSAIVDSVCLLQAIIFPTNIS